MRLAFAVVTGYFIFAISAAVLFQVAQQDPHAEPSLNFAVVSVVWGMVFAALGGFVAVLGAQRTGRIASLLVGCLIAAGALTSLLLTRGSSHWSQLTAMFLMAPSAWAGGLIKRRRGPS